jgi:hypothetical protein
MRTNLKVPVLVRDGVEYLLLGCVVENGWGGEVFAVSSALEQPTVLELSPAEVGALDDGMLAKVELILERTI